MERILISLSIPIVIFLCLHNAYASTVQISDNGKTATLTMPLKATITADSIIRDGIAVTPLSSLYEIVKWDQNSKRFKAHEFLVRVDKDSVVPVLFEIVNDQYTCSYNNPDRMNNLPIDIAVVNSDYRYNLSWSGGNIDMGKTRAATVDDKDAWLSSSSENKKFIDLTLHITFPDMSSYSQLINNGGICRGSVTMLLSNKL